MPVHGAVVTLITSALSGGSEKSVESVFCLVVPLGQNTMKPINVAIAATPTAAQIARATFVSATNSGRYSVELPSSAAITVTVMHLRSACREGVSTVKMTWSPTNDSTARSTTGCTTSTSSTPRPPGHRRDARRCRHLR